MCSSNTEGLANVRMPNEITKPVHEGNPFFHPYNTPFNIPPFEKIKIWHYIPAFKEGIKRQKKEIAAIVNNPAPPDFNNTVEALEKSGELLKEVKNVFEVLKAAHSNERLQKTAGEVSALLAHHKDDIHLDPTLFDRIKKVYEKKDRLNLSEEQQMLLDDYYKEFVRGGANLPPGKQERFREINEDLSLLKVRFENNVLNDTNDFSLVIEDPGDLEGLPKVLIHAAADTAEKHGHPGKWVFNLCSPCLFPFLQYSKKRCLRERIFKAYLNLGNNGNEFDNKEILARVIRLRAERARLLGYKNHAEYLLERNMARNPANVYWLLDQLWKPSLEMAKRELGEIQALIDRECGNFKLQPWDWWYYSEKLRKKKYKLDDHMLRRYFRLENVLDGVFYVARRLFGLTFRELTDVPRYHKSVRGFEVLEADGSHVGILYFDFFPRAAKQSGAWMAPLRKQARKNGSRIAPVATNNVNFRKPTAHKPSLLNLEEVKTLFHEFGHALHSLLSDCTYERLSGSSVAMDFVELPSQVMENWVIEPEVLKMFARHYETGEVIPAELIDKIRMTRHFNHGFVSVEYLAASYLDMDWHTLDDPGEIDVNAFEKASLDRIGLIPEIVVRYKSTYFNHIFGGGYSAGYYSYVWAEVLDADAFEAFKETGIFDQATALGFRKNILERGASASPMTLYKRFRGAEPGIGPLLARSGLTV